MRRMRSIMGPLSANAALFAAAQVTVAGTPLTLAATTLPNATAGQLHNSAAPVQFTGVAATIASNYTVVGLDRHGQKQTEIVVGPVGATTTTGHLLFNTILSITPSVTNNPGTIAVGVAGINYGPWLVTAYHSAGSQVFVPASAPNYTLQVTQFNLLDATFFLPQGGGGEPVNNLNSGNGYFAPTDAPYVDQPITPWPLVPAALQTSCPQLLSTNQCLPEEDGTYSQALIAPTTFTAAAPGAAGTTSQIRLDPVEAFAWRLVYNSGSGLIELDLTIQRRAY